MQLNKGQIYPTGSAFQSFQIKRRASEEKLKTSGVINRKDKNIKSAVLGAAVFGAVAPVVALNLLKGRGSKMLSTLKSPNAGFINKFNSVRDLFETEGFTEMLCSTTGAIGLGMAAGILKDKNPKNQKAKIKEGAFEFFNNMIPTCLVAISKAVADKTGYATKGAAKGLRVFGSVALGMAIANKTSNKLNKDVFDKKEKTPKIRKFKPLDCLVHTDDLVGIFVVEKNPIARAVQLDKILPFLYARAGFEAGIAEDKRPSEH